MYTHHTCVVLILFIHTHWIPSYWVLVCVSVGVCVVKVCAWCLHVCGGCVTVWANEEAEDDVSAFLDCFSAFFFETLNPELTSWQASPPPATWPTLSGLAMQTRPVIPSFYMAAPSLFTSFPFYLSRIQYSWDYAGC